MLNVKLGDMLCFDVMGLMVDVFVISVCKFDWGLFCVNFFVLMLLFVLKDFLVVYLISFYLLVLDVVLFDLLIVCYLNLIVIDVVLIFV